MTAPLVDYTLSMPAAAAPTPAQLARLGALLADPSRAAMLLALMDGTMRPAGELAHAAGIGAATASAHLQRLVGGGLLARQSHGRHRYYRLASDEVAAWLEAVALPHATPFVPVVSGDAALRRARTCYRHLAGQLGVAVCASWLECGWLRANDAGFQMLPAAADALTDAGWEPETTQRLLTLRGRPCLDWTERRIHIGGALGAALADGMLEAGWLRRKRTGRGLIPSAEGLRRLASLRVTL